MSALTIDTRAMTQILRKRGFSEEQAIGVVEAFREIDAGALASKADLRETETRLEAKIAVVESKIDAKIEASKAEILRWLFASQVALGGFILAALKFLR
jgi:carbamoylphosphate synthase small subunit